MKAVKNSALNKGRFVGHRYVTKLKLPNGVDYVQSAEKFAPTMINRIVNNQRVYVARGEGSIFGSFVVVWTIDDGCSPKPKGKWVDQGCVVTPDNNVIVGHKYWVQLIVAKNDDWKITADLYARSMIGELVEGLTTVDLKFYRTYQI